MDSGGFVSGNPLDLAAAALGLASTSAYIGAATFGPAADVIGVPITLDSTGLPPYPVIVTKSGDLTQWSASFDTLLAANPGADLGDPVNIVAALWLAPALTTTPEDLSDLSFTEIATMDLGEIPTTGTFQTYFGTDTLPTAIPIETGDRLLVQFYIENTTFAAVATGFHAQASLLIV